MKNEIQFEFVGSTNIIIDSFLNYCVKKNYIIPQINIYHFKLKSCLRQTSQFFSVPEPVNKIIFLFVCV